MAPPSCSISGVVQWAERIHGCVERVLELVLYRQRAQLISFDVIITALMVELMHVFIISGRINLDPQLPNFRTKPSGHEMTA